jgi:hypothetical protein
MKNELNLGEARALVRKAEGQIMGVLEELYSQTGLQVDAVDLESVDVIDGMRRRRMIACVNVITEKL